MNDVPKVYIVMLVILFAMLEVHMTNTTLRNQKETKERAIALWNRRVSDGAK